MKRTLVVTMGVALALTLAGCSGSSDSDTTPAPSISAMATDASAAPDREALIAELRADGEANGASAEEIDCVVNALESLDADQLQSMKDGTPDADTQTVMDAASEECLPADTASPEPSE